MVIGDGQEMVGPDGPVLPVDGALGGNPLQLHEPLGAGVPPEDDRLHQVGAAIIKIGDGQEMVGPDGPVLPVDGAVGGNPLKLHKPLGAAVPPEDDRLHQ